MELLSQALEQEHMIVIAINLLVGHHLSTWDTTLDSLQFNICGISYEVIGPLDPRDGSLANGVVRLESY
eukprot:SAG31_NODE_5344_length_2595_cov_2.038061_3_plen_69_part_00